jgi:hypothetical protein
VRARRRGATSMGRCHEPPTKSGSPHRNRKLRFHDRNGTTELAVVVFPRPMDDKKAGPDGGRGESWLPRIHRAPSSDNPTVGSVGSRVVRWTRKTTTTNNKKGQSRSTRTDGTATTQRTHLVPVQVVAAVTVASSLLLVPGWCASLRRHRRRHRRPRRRPRVLPAPDPLSPRVALSRWRRRRRRRSSRRRICCRRSRRGRRGRGPVPPARLLLLLLLLVIALASSGL